MDPHRLGPDALVALDELIGYVNFSAGTPDASFQRRVNELFGHIERYQPEGTWGAVGRIWKAWIERSQGTKPAFGDLEQARRVVELVFEQFLPAYREYHRDLLFHQTDDALFRPFFLCRACEAVLRQGPPWDERERIVRGTIATLDDFVGYRPLAILERKKVEPYAHERVRPVPLYLRGVGIGTGRYAALVDQALEILKSTPSAMLAAAGFDLNLLDELAFDPRAYDFDHPVNKRPNYHFGQWDPACVDEEGHYRRFVVTQVTLEALLERVELGAAGVRAAELLTEASAVLAGVILMSAAVSGAGPAAYDSTITLATLLPRIAQNRDRFYERLIEQLPPGHRKRLKNEATALRQPLAGARQHLNRSLARRRAWQLQHVHLAGLFARLGYPEIARRQAAVVQVASARMTSEIDCRLTIGHQALARGEIETALAMLGEAVDLLHRAIECGALMDPWNLLGYAGNFPLFPAVENTVHDHRVEELVEQVDRIFALCTRATREAAAGGQAALVGKISDQTESLASWWDQFASVEVESLESFSGLEIWESGVHVAAALRAWKEAGAGAGDVGFWRTHVEKFDSPKAFALVVETLLDKGDYVAAMSLLVQWLSEAEELPLAEGEHSFHNLAVRWMQEIQPAADAPADAAAQAWTVARKFLDYLEANAEEYWDVPVFELAEMSPESEEEAMQYLRELFDDEETDEDEEREGDLYAAAYEDVTYRDSTDDDNEGEVLESGGETDYELDFEAARLRDRLSFLVTVARLWRIAAACMLRSGHGRPPAELADALAAWRTRAEESRRRLAELLRHVHKHPLEPVAGHHQAMVEYGRRRQVKLGLLERIVAASVEYGDAVRVIAAALGDEGEAPAVGGARGPRGLARWERPVVRLLRALAGGDRERSRVAFAEVLTALGEQPVLYVPLSRGGGPQRVLAAQHVLKVVRQLLVALPRSGLLRETFALLAAVQKIERDFVPGPGAVTEFDRLFQLGFNGLIEGLLRSTEGAEGARVPDAEMVDAMHQLTESALRRWLEHSRSLRLSALERIADDESWKRSKAFVERYGHDLFMQRFLNYGHLRAILHQGVGNWLQALSDEPEPEAHFKLLDELDANLPREAAVEDLEIVLESIVENYVEYRDYNSTTTQSDRGEQLYVLLDFLRLKSSYQRIAWNLRPVFQAHELLVRHGRDEAAELWRQAVAERTADVASWHQRRLEQLVEKYGVRLPTIADRIAESFTRPLAVDRVRALLAPVRIDPRTGKATGPAELVGQLEQELVEFTDQPSGVGLDVPDWLQALEEEEQELAAPRGVAQMSIVELLVAPVRLTLAEALAELAAMDEGESAGGAAEKG